MKSHIKKLVPIFLLDRYRYFKQFAVQRLNRNRPPEEIFTEIYAQNKWGGSEGDFYSGPGSTDEKIVSAYIKVITDRAYSEKFIGLSFIDLGCGDFIVGRELVPLCSNYTGIDIVESLVKHNNKHYGADNINFMKANIVDDELPIGDVCFVRQVFQHLSNQQIIAILPKLKKYKWVFITEHYPTNNSSVIPNIDKICSYDIRLEVNSGVYFTEPPFDLPIESIENVLEMPVVSAYKGIDPGVIRTLLYKPLD